MLDSARAAVELKSVLGGVSVVIGVFTYGVYISQTLKKQGIQPHPFSWLLWGFVTSVAALAQHADGAGPGFWVTALTAVACFLIGMLTFSKNDWTFSKSDWVALILGGVATAFYALVNNPTAAAVFATVADVIGYKPTVSKGWADPTTENAVSFFLNSVKFIPALVAMNNHSIATSLYPAALVIVNGGVWLMLVVRGRQLRQSTA
jgi:hypothetical protein